MIIELFYACSVLARLARRLRQEIGLDPPLGRDGAEPHWGPRRAPHFTAGSTFRICLPLAESVRVFKNAMRPQPNAWFRSTRLLRPPTAVAGNARRPLVLVPLGCNSPENARTMLARLTIIAASYPIGEPWRTSPMVIQKIPDESGLRHRRVWLFHADDRVLRALF
jgi:hypothetical protein